MTENQAELTKYDTSHSDLITQLIFDDRINPTMLRIAKLLSIKKKHGDGTYSTIKYFSGRGISKMIDKSIGSTMEALRFLKEINIIQHEDNLYFISDSDRKTDHVIGKPIRADRKTDHKRSENRSFSDRNPDHNIYKENIYKELDKSNIQKTPISFDPVFKSDHQDVEASYIQNGNSVECSFKFKPKQELEQATQTPRLPAIKSTESNLEALAPDRIPNLLPKCEYFKISDHNKKLVREWFKENGMTDDHIKLAVREVELWLKNAKKGSKAFKARKVTGQSDHHLYLYSAWVQENLAKRFKASASMQQVGKVNVEAELYQEYCEAFGNPTGTVLSFDERQRLQEHRAFKSFLANDNKEIE